MLGMVIPLSFSLHYKYMEMTAEMFHAARPRRAGRPYPAPAGAKGTQRGRGRRPGPKVQRSGTARPRAAATAAPRPPPPAEGTTPPSLRRRGAPHNGRAAAAPPPHQIRPPPRDASRPPPARAARRRAPPLAAGTPENPIARAGGREAKGRRHPRQPAHRRGEPPAPPFFDCDNIKPPPAAQHLVCAPYGTYHI